MIVEKGPSQKKKKKNQNSTYKERKLYENLKTDTQIDFQKKNQKENK